MAIARIDDGKIIGPQPLGANYWMRNFDANSARLFGSDVSLVLLLSRSFRVSLCCITDYHPLGCRGVTYKLVR